MRTIANHVGCSVGSLPHYFKGKEEIVGAALNWSNERILTRLDTMPLEEVTIDTLIPVVISSLPLDEQSDIEWRVRLCLWDYAATNPELLEKVKEVRRQTLSVLNRLLGHLQKKGYIAKDLPPEAMSTSIYHMAIGLGFNLLHVSLDKREEHVLPLISYIDFLRPQN
jgi:AcrR family transcriptional regulator